MSATPVHKGPYLVMADACKCAGCMTCMLRCSFKAAGSFNFAAAKIRVTRLLNQPNEFKILFTDECDACGICVKYCPYGALTRKKAGKEMSNDTSRLCR
jgi:ferredoxin